MVLFLYETAARLKLEKQKIPVNVWPRPAEGRPAEQSVLKQVFGMWVFFGGTKNPFRLGWFKTVNV